VASETEVALIAGSVSARAVKNAHHRRSKSQRWAGALVVIARVVRVISRIRSGRRVAKEVLARAGRPRGEQPDVVGSEVVVVAATPGGVAPLVGFARLRASSAHASAGFPAFSEVVVITGDLGVGVARLIGPARSRSVGSRFRFTRASPVIPVASQVIVLTLIFGPLLTWLIDAAGVFRLVFYAFARS
jgi:hypothetical protein